MRIKELKNWTSQLYEIEDSLDNVPEGYADFFDVFSKEASKVLPPHRSYDHKIILDREHDLKYSPLYKMSLEELEATKKYLTKHLSHGIIKPS